MNVDFVGEQFVVIDGVRLPICFASYAEVDPDFEEFPAWFIHLPMENRAQLLLFVPDDGQATLGLLLDVGGEPWENINFEARIESSHGALHIRPTRWTQRHSESDEVEAVMDLMEDPQWSCDVDDVTEVTNFLCRWSQLPVVNAISAAVS